MNSLHGNYTEKSIELIGRSLLVKRDVMDKFCGPRGKVFFFNIKFVCLFRILSLSSTIGQYFIYSPYHISDMILVALPQHRAGAGLTSPCS